MRVGVAGAGLAGLAAAALLAQDGHEVQVFEAAKEPRPLGAGLLLQPPGAHILGRIGALASVAASAANITRLRGATVSGRTLLAVDYADLGPGVHGLGIARPSIWSALMASCDRAGAAILPGMQVTGIAADAEAAQMVLQSGERRRFDLVVVASGTHSGLWRARRHHSRPYAWGCLWAAVRLPRGWPADTLQQRCDGTGVMAGVLPIGEAAGETCAALYWSIRNDAVESWRVAPIAAWRDAMLRLWPATEPLVAGLSHADFTHAAYRDNWADPPHHGRLVAIGDAAHGTSPQLGQGTTQALRDGLALTEALRDAALDQALARYWHERRRRTAYYRHASRLLTPVFQSDGRWLGMVRDQLAGPIGTIPFVRRQAALTLAGAKTGWLTADRFEPLMETEKVQAAEAA